MTTDSPYPGSAVPADYALARQRSFLSSVSWGAIFAGLVAALAFEVLFMLLGAGLGFAIYSPLTDAKPMTDFAGGALVIEGVSAVFSLWFGGWVAGRFTPTGSRSLGGLHGFLVWCAATVSGVILVSLGAGWVTGDVSKLVGGGLSMAGKPAAAVAGQGADAVKDGAKQSSDTLASFTDEALGGRTNDGNKGTTVRAKRDISMAVAKLFNPMQADHMQDNRAALIKVLQDDGGMSQSQAEKTVDDWTASYNDLKAQLNAAKEQAAAKAREAADESARVLSILSLTAFVGFCFGAAAAAFGGRFGAKHAVRSEARATVVL